MGLIDVIGFMAAVLTTASFVPQAVRTWRTRETRGISLLMYAVFSSGVALWVVYGFLAPSWPVFAANAVTLVFALAILVMKVRYERPGFVNDGRLAAGEPLQGGTEGGGASFGA
ncbi:MAG: SemiSWEET transporter [Zoogloeaceae bacterium]|nr:SemiSWEET family sugar transporter [Rhodocyclaceae bacterium]MCP5233465.1 SemiSWEET transporter [Zoogloeaceae bacterium]MCW5616908.1 SemiSWEET family sugar transporter [Rhodocyclaceae bacterium]